MVTPNQTTFVPGEIDSLTGEPVVRSESVRTAAAQTLDQALLALRRDIPDGSVGSFTRLPAVARDGQVALVNNQFWRGHEEVSSEITVRPADDPVGGSDDRGYVRGSFGSIDHESQHPGYHEIRWDNDARSFILRVESTTDTGPTYNARGHTLGTYAMRKTAGDGSGIYSTWATRGSGRYQYEIGLQFDPFALLTEETFTFTPDHPITYWQQLDIAAATDSNVGGVAFTAADERKLAGIEAGATGDMTAAEIKADYESNADTNAFTNADRNKLIGIEDNATADQTAEEIKRLYESNPDTNAFTDAAVQKLAGIEEGATVGGGGTSGLESVNSDATLTGTGVSGDPLSVVNPYTTTAAAQLAAALTKLATIEDNATADQTAAQIRDALATLTGTNRLSASAIRDLGSRSEHYATVAARDSANPQPPAGTLGVVHADTPARNGFYYKTTGNPSWTELLVGPHYTDAAADLRVAAAKGTGTPAAVAVGAGAAGDSDSWAPFNHQHPYEDPGTGDGGDGYTDADADDRIEAHTGQSNPRDTIAINRMPPDLQLLARDVVEGGPREWPTTDIQIGGPIRAQPYTGNAQARVATFGTSATHAGGTAVGPNTHFFMQFDKVGLRKRNRPRRTFRRICASEPAARAHAINSTSPHTDAPPHQQFHALGV